MVPTSKGRGGVKRIENGQEGRRGERERRGREGQGGSCSKDFKGDRRPCPQVFLTDLCCFTNCNKLRVLTLCL